MDETGFILIGHGSKNPKMLIEFHYIMEKVKAFFPKNPLHFCFLEGPPPRCQESLKEIVLKNRNLKKIIFIPLLLFSSKHYQFDIPMIIQESQLNYPSIQFFAQTPFMINRKLFKLLNLRIEEKLERNREINTEKKTILILVARGTKNINSKKSFEQIRRLTEKNFPFSKVYSSYMAVTGPKIEQTLREAIDENPYEIIIAPYLLFYGSLVKKIEEKTRKIIPQESRVKVKVAHHLGAHPLLSLAVKEKCLPYLS